MDELEEDIGSSLEEDEDCPFGLCDGSGEIPCDEDDGEGHIMNGVGIQKCPCKIKDDEYEPEE